MKLLFLCPATDDEIDRLAEEMRKLSEPVRYVYCSDELNAKETAIKIARRLNKPCSSDKRLRGFGSDIEERIISEYNVFFRSLRYDRGGTVVIVGDISTLNYVLNLKGFSPRLTQGTFQIIDFLK